MAQFPHPLDEAPSPGQAERVRVISGGQTGVDRAALDAAIELGIEHGGWCPLGRLAEDGAIPTCYRLRETESADYAARTERNVLEADATLILTRGELTGGTKLTAVFAMRHGKPFLVVDLDRSPDIEQITAWLLRHDVRILDVAGPRESTCPGIYTLAKSFLRQLLPYWLDRIRHHGV